MIRTRPHTPTIHISAERVPLILAAAVGAWLGLYTLGYGLVSLIALAGGA